MEKLQTLLNFIQKIEAANSSKSLYEIANILRGYTKPSYASRLWTTATGYEQKYIEGTLNCDVILSGVETDFGHFIGALSDQINEPGIRWSDFTRWTADHTSWAGDIGSAIATYRSTPDQGKFTNLEEALNRFARDSDHTANIAAYLVGKMLNSYQQPSISQAILHYNHDSYQDNIYSFLKKRFKGIIENKTLQNPAKVDSKIRRSVSTFMKFSLASELLKSVKSLEYLPSQLDGEALNFLNSYDLLQGSSHFLTHLVKFGELAPLEFKPYRRTRFLWLGTVDYTVRVPKA